MRVDCAARLACRLDFDAFATGLDRIAGVDALHDQIGLAIEILVLGQRSRMPRHARRQHVGEQAGHDCRPQHVVHALQPLSNQCRVHIEEKVIDVLHRKLEILEPELEWQDRFRVECPVIDLVSLDHLGSLASVTRV